MSARSTRACSEVRKCYYSVLRKGRGQGLRRESRICLQVRKPRGRRVRETVAVWNEGRAAVQASWKESLQSWAQHSRQICTQGEVSSSLQAQVSCLAVQYLELLQFNGITAVQLCVLSCAIFWLCRSSFNWNRNCLDQCFSTFFKSRNLSKISNHLAEPEHSIQYYL